MRLKEGLGMTEFTSETSCKDTYQFFFFFSLFLFDLIRRFRLFAHYGRLYMHESLLPREHRPWHCLADKPSSGLGDMKSHVNTAHMKAPPSNLNCSIGWNTGNYSQPYPSASI